MCAIFDLPVTFDWLDYIIYEGSEKEIITYNKLGDVLLRWDLNAMILQQMMTTCIYQCMIYNIVLKSKLETEKFKMGKKTVEAKIC